MQTVPDVFDSRFLIIDTDVTQLGRPPQVQTVAKAALSSFVENRLPVRCWPGAKSNQLQPMSATPCIADGGAHGRDRPQRVDNQ